MDKQRYISSICDKICIKQAQWAIQDLKRSGKKSFELFICLFVWFGLFFLLFFPVLAIKHRALSYVPKALVFVCVIVVWDGLLYLPHWLPTHCYIAEHDLELLVLLFLLAKYWDYSFVSLCLVFRQCWRWNWASWIVGKHSNNWAISQSLSWLC